MGSFSKSHGLKVKGHTQKKFGRVYSFDFSDRGSLRVPIRYDGIPSNCGAHKAEGTAKRLLPSPIDGGSKNVSFGLLRGDAPSLMIGCPGDNQPLVLLGYCHDRTEFLGSCPQVQAVWRTFIAIDSYLEKVILVHHAAVGQRPEQSVSQGGLATVGHSAEETKKKKI